MAQKFNETRFTAKIRACHRLFESRAKAKLKRRFFPELLDYKKVLTAINKAEKNGFDSKTPLAEEISRIVREETVQIAKGYEEGVFGEVHEKRGRYANILVAASAATALAWVATVFQFPAKTGIALPKTKQELWLAISTILLSAATAFFYKVAGRYETAVGAINEALANMATWSGKYGREKTADGYHI